MIQHITYTLTVKDHWSRDLDSGNMFNLLLRFINVIMHVHLLIDAPLVGVRLNHCDTFKEQGYK